MKKIFGFYNDCYWMMIMTLEDLYKNLNRINHLQNQIPQFKEALAEGKTIFVNRAGGWHTGDIEEKKDYIALDNFPTADDRLRYLSERIILCRDIDASLQKEIEKLEKVK
ncbi:MAG: hypothetical protein AABY15_06950 [Nanoarchaeota archaeon]